MLLLILLWPLETRVKINIIYKPASKSRLQIKLLISKRFRAVTEKVFKVKHKFIGTDRAH